MKPESWSLKIYLNHRAALIDYAVPIVGCRARAEDVVHDAFLRYRARAAKATGVDAPLSIDYPVSYFYRIVRNLALDWARRSAASAEVAADATFVYQPAATATPEQTLLARDRLRIVADALVELPERTRVAFDMHRIEGRSLQEVADHLGVSVARAHQLVRDALRHVALRLEAVDRE